MFFHVSILEPLNFYKDLLCLFACLLFTLYLHFFTPCIKRHPGRDENKHVILFSGKRVRGNALYAPFGSAYVCKLRTVAKSLTE